VLNRFDSPTNIESICVYSDWIDKSSISHPSVNNHRHHPSPTNQYQHDMLSSSNTSNTNDRSSEATTARRQLPQLPNQMLTKKMTNVTRSIQPIVDTDYNRTLLPMSNGLPSTNNTCVQQTQGKSIRFAQVCEFCVRE
jgi:hypothetical protein